jgi:antitoxin (DNA-binding transcriptional repressor) of toxin-antitoxin stability system
MQQIDIENTKATLPDLVEAVLNGIEVIIAKDHQPVAKLIPISPEKPRRRAGSAKGLIQMSDDFDVPLEELKEYME